MSRQPAEMAQPRQAPFVTYPCPCRAEHAPPVPYTHRHHILPLYAGGRDEPGNVAYICPATHDWAHAITRHFESAGRVVPRLRTWPRYAYELAVDGWTRRTA